MGYTPVFDSVYAGSLCGRWPTTAVWVTLLPLADKYGRIDLSYQAICALTGWPMDLLQQGIAELMKPDPDSRSNAEEGRRLVLLDPESRNWGWRVVNHGLYREKARKLQYDSERTASGRDAERKRASREVPRCPDASREVPLSDSDSDSDKSKRKPERAGADAPLVLHASLPRESWEEWLAHRRERRLSMSPRALNKQLKLLADYPTEVQREIIDTSIQAGWEGLFRPKGKAKPNGGNNEWT